VTVLTTVKDGRRCAAARHDPYNKPRNERLQEKLLTGLDTLTTRVERCTQVEYSLVF